MTRLIYVPALPIKMRYQEWYYSLFPDTFKEHFDDVIILGPDMRKSSMLPIPDTEELFSCTEASIQLECYQMQGFLENEIRDDDILLLGDLSFPGIFANVLFHKPIKNAYAICHGTSKNKYDIFSPMKKQKWLVEKGHSKLFKKIFVATEYHKRKLGLDNTVVTSLPFPPALPNVHKSDKRGIISVTRPGIQKVNKKLERKVEKQFNTVIKRNTFTEWFDYYQYISNSKMLLSTAKEETFGYQIVDAIIGGTVPVAPNKFSYPELLPREYLYDNEEELYQIINNVFDDKLPIPTKLSCQEQTDNFFNNIAEIMKEGL